MKKFDTEIRLSREMSLMDVTLIGVGAMIGAGIFVLTGIAAGVAGPALLLVFLLNGVITLFTAMSYAELGSCYHDAGGGYLWVKEGLPAWNGFLSGWMSWFAHAVACSLYALGFGAYFHHVLSEFGIGLPHLGPLSPEKLLAVIIALIFAYVNFRGASETGKIGNLVTLVKIFILLIFIAFGLNLVFRRPDWKDAFTPFMPYGMGGVLKAMGLTFIAFQGYEVISQCSEEVKDPKRNIPRAVFLSIAIVVPIYIFVGIVALGAVRAESGTPWSYLASHGEIALVEVARHFFVGGGVLILFGGLISTISALNATIYSSSRVAYAMGRDRNFPAFFSKVHTKKYTPYWAIYISSIIIVLMAVSLPIEDVASAADIMFLLLFLQVNFAVISIRKKRPDLDRGFVIPLFPAIPIAGIIMMLFLAVYMFNYSHIAWIVTISWIVAGITIYKTYASKREVEHIRKIRSLESIEKKEYRILVSISNPKSLKSLGSLAFGIARKHNAEVVFLHVIEVGENEKLLAGMGDTSRARPILEEAMESAAHAGVRARSLIKISHRISQGIVDSAIEESCNFIIMGRQKNPSFLERVFSSLIDTIIQKSPCEIAVLHGELESSRVRKIVLPFGTNIHTNLALEIAPALVSHFQAKLIIAAVIDPDLPLSVREMKKEEITKMVQNLEMAQVNFIYDKDIPKAILDQSLDADLVLMGGRSGDFLELLLAQSLTQEITESTDCPVLWVKEYEESQPIWRRLFRQDLTGGERNVR